MSQPPAYATFVLRHWRRDDGVERVEIEHVQGGSRVRVASLAEALAWIDARADDVTRQRTVPQADSSGATAR